MLTAADTFITEVIADPRQPVVLFALEWCEFCWSVRKLFQKLGITYRSIDLDSVEYQRDQRGQKIRAALTAHTAMQTIPQIFIGGEFVGGCTDLFDAWKAGRVQLLLEKAGVTYTADTDIDPYDFLPGWLHPRQPNRD
jgi:cysteine synthase